jgi:hypothetical protein
MAIAVAMCDSSVAHGCLHQGLWLPPRVVRKGLGDGDAAYHWATSLIRVTEDTGGSHQSSSARIRLDHTKRRRKLRLGIVNCQGHAHELARLVKSTKTWRVRRVIDLCSLCAHVAECPAEDRFLTILVDVGFAEPTRFQGIMWCHSLVSAAACVKSAVSIA